MLNRVSKINCWKLFVMKKFKDKCCSGNTGFATGSFVLFLVIFLVLAGVGGVAYYYLALRTIPVDVVISPTPTSVYIDGNEVDYDPEKPIQITEGSHIIEAVTPGYNSLREEIDVIGIGENVYSFTMNPLGGLLSVYATEKGAKVYINDELVGETPLIDHEMSAGKYKVRIKPGKDFQEYREIVVMEGKRGKKLLDVNLIRSWSWITVDSVPPGARIIDPDKSEVIDVTPMRRKFYEGEYSLELSYGKEYKTQSLSFNVIADQDQVIPKYEFDLLPGALDLQTEPSGATVIIEGLPLENSITPFYENIPPNREWKVVVAHPQFHREEFLLLLEPGEEYEKSIELLPYKGKIEIVSEPEGADVLIDNVAKGRTPLELELNSGDYSILLRKAKYMDMVVKVIVPRERSVVKEVTLESIGKNGVSVDIASLPQNWKAPNGAEMVLVKPKGVFTIGSPASEPTRAANEDQVNVELRVPFYVATMEVSNKEYRMALPLHNSGKLEGFSLNTGSRPVVNINWHEAAAYCNWLSQQAGVPEVYTEKKPGIFETVSPRPSGFRLLTEAEFEYLCRAGYKGYHPFPWGSKIPPPAYAANIADETAKEMVEYIVKGYNDNNLVTAPVGTFNANPLGLYDLAGNASEWVHNVYEPMYPMSPAVLVDPAGPASGSIHSVRGSSFLDGAYRKIRTAYRGFGAERTSFISFRIMVSARAVSLMKQLNK